MRRRSNRWAQVAEHVHTAGDLWLAGRMFGWACGLRLLKRLIPLPALVSLVRRSGAPGGNAAEPDPRVVAFARWSCRITAWPRTGNCLERGLLLYRFLGLTNARPSLVVGFERGDERSVRGHAWVVVGGRPVDEPDASLSTFETAFTFDPDGRVALSAK
jgi:transglutaminase superfamily protein